jgi:hypothetical protein
MTNWFKENKIKAGSLFILLSLLFLIMSIAAGKGQIRFISISFSIVLEMIAGYFLDVFKNLRN